MVSDGKSLTKLWFLDQGSNIAQADAEENPDAEPFAEARKQFDEYFSGDRTTFTIPIEPAGTVFQLSVWRALQTIPYGHTISYGEVAKHLGDGQLARAVGLANGKNPLSIIVPCHRVIGADGSLTGYGGGLKIKQFLLNLESPSLVLPGF